MATELDLKMHAGDTKTIDITFQDDTVPVNITGATITFVVAHSPGSPAVLTKATGGAGIVITNGVGGVARVTLSPADTATLKGLYYYEAECVESGGTEWTGLYGCLTILPTSA